MPITTIREGSTPGAFVVNDDGTITINEPGVYLVTSKVQVDTGYPANFYLQLNDRGVLGQYSVSYSVTNGGTATVTTIMHVHAGDILSNKLQSATEINLTPAMSGLRTIPLLITMVKIADLI